MLTVKPSAIFTRLPCQRSTSGRFFSGGGRGLGRQLPDDCRRNPGTRPTIRAGVLRAGLLPYGYQKHQHSRNSRQATALFGLEQHLRKKCPQPDGRRVDGLLFGVGEGCFRAHINIITPQGFRESATSGTISTGWEQFAAGASTSMIARSTPDAAATWERLRAAYPDEFAISAADEENWSRQPAAVSAPKSGEE